MKSNKIIFTASLAAAALSAGAWAQPANVSTPPSEVIYLPQLPTPADLSQGAAAHGQTLGRIEQTGNRVVAVYNGPNGQTLTVDYELLPSQTGAPAQAQGPTLAPEIYAQPQGYPAQQQAYAPAPGDVAPTNTVVYSTPPAYGAYPYDYYPYGYYWPFYPAVSIGFGFHYGLGYGYGYRYGYGFRGGYGYGHPVARGFGYHPGAGFRGGGYRGGGGSHR